MIDLASDRWGELQHAYGLASDVPAMLTRLSRAADAEARRQAWDPIWSALCHQGDVYSASYAAIPHLLVLGRDQCLEARQDTIQFIACVEAFRHRRSAPPIPADVEPSYRAAIEQLTAMIGDTLCETVDENAAQVIAGALAVVKGHPRLGMAIIGLERSESCPDCGRRIPVRGWDLDEGI
jgi:hypothetical protein